MGLDYLYDLQTALLGEALDAIDVPRTGRPLPCVSYVAMSAPVIDKCCEACAGEAATPGGGGMMTVHLGGDRDPLDFTPPDQNNCQILTTANLVITLARCVPTQTGELGPIPPTPADLDASALRLYGDLWALVTYLLGRRHDAGFLAGMGGCKGITFTTVRYLSDGPTGGCGGWEVSLRVKLNDFGPWPGS